MSTGNAEGRAVGVAPMVPLALAVSAGVLIDRYANPCDTTTWRAIALGASCAVLIGGWWSDRIWTLLICAAFVALGGGCHHLHWSDLEPDDLALNPLEQARPVWVRGVLADVLGFRPGHGARDEGSTKAVMEVSGWNDGTSWHEASGRVQVVVPGDRTDLVAGDAVEAAGSLDRFAGPLNPGEFDYREYMRGQGIRLRLTLHDTQGIWRVEGNSPWTWTRWLGMLRAWSHRRLTRGLDAQTAPLAAALLLGRREGVDPDVTDAFARTGTTHLLAISGLHLQVLACVLWLVFRIFGLSRRGAFAAVALVTVGYALLVGFMPSVVRSAAMTVTGCVAGLIDRNRRSANTLAAAWLITLAFNPSNLFDIGGQLSFLAIAAIFWGVAPAQNALKLGVQRVLRKEPDDPLDALERRLEPSWRKVPRWLGRWLFEGFVISTVVWLAALPLVALRFHVISPMGILLNIPLVPITSLALLAAGLSLGLSAIWEPLGIVGAWPCSFLLWLTEFIVRWGAAQSWGHRFVAGPSWEWTVVFYSLLGLAAAAWIGGWIIRRGAVTALGGWATLGLCLSIVPPRSADALEAETLAVGHGLAIVIRTSDGHTLLYDCGKMGDASVGRRIIAPALWAKGIQRLDEVILSHADSDHYDGLPDLLDRFVIGAVRVAPGFGGPLNPGAEELLRRIEARGIAVRPIKQGDHWEWGEARFAVWHPPESVSPSATDNARSVVLDLEANGHHALLTGDLEGQGLTALIARRTEPLAMILAPHHGGRSANPGWLYAWARPDRVVASQRQPSLGNGDALADLAKRGIPVSRTWQSGAIQIRWTNQRLVTHGFLDDRKEREPMTMLSAAWTGWPILLGDSGLGMGLTRGLVGVLGFGLGLIACGTLLVVEWGAWTLVLPRRRLNGDDVDEGPGESIEAIAHDGVRLAGTWHAAEPSNGRTVLVLHGFAEPTSLQSRIDALNAHGWNVASLDSRGHGRSAGVHTSFGGREGDDLRAWIDALTPRLGSTPHVAAWGRSMGAAVVMRAAAEDPRINAIVLEAPYVDLELAIARVLRRFHIPLARAFARLIAHRAERLAGVSLTRPRPVDVAPRIAAQALIVHGTNDTLVPLADAQRLAEALPHFSQLIEVAGAGHSNVISVGGADVLQEIATFLDQHGLESAERADIR